MKLFVLEKRAQAGALIQALGGAWSEEAGYFEGEHLITWASGHLLQLQEPEHYKKEWRRWRAQDLPIMPEELRTRSAGGDRKKQLGVIKKLADRTDVTEIINACDAGREGELIFAWIHDSLNKKGRAKPVRRLWLQALSEKAIREGLSSLRDQAEMLPLEAAARARSSADWLLGINATRAATLSLRDDGVVSLGRVQTPTLALLVRREEEISAFVPEKFWTVEAEFSSGGKSYSGKHQSGRMKEAKAKEIVSRCLGKQGEIVSVKKKNGSEKQPLLHDLTTLQREASALWGWSAKQTLGIAQSLYEKKALSYPRTDSRYLPDSMAEELRALIKSLGGDHQTDSLLGLDKVPRHVFDNAKVRDHHALLALLDPGSFAGREAKLLELVRDRMLQTLLPEAEFVQTEIISEVESERFRSSGKRYTSPGWRAVRGTEEREIADVAQGDQTKISSIESLAGETKPPARFSDGKLLGLMEAAGRDLDDDAAREAMKDHGLGTPATRAAIIERLIAVDYVEREGRTLRATEKGISVIKALGKSPLLEAELTGKWERQLLDLEEGASAQEFDQRIRAWIREQTTELQKLPPLQRDKSFGPCPHCGKEMQENRAAVSCWSKDDPGCGFVVWKKMAGKKLPLSAIRELIEKGKTEKQIPGFRSKSGKTFRARLALEKKEGKWQTVFNEDWAREK